MLAFKDKYIYSVDPVNQQITTLMTLPIKWKDPVTKISYSNLHFLSESELNDIGWYKIMEDHPIETMTEYQIEAIDTYSFDLINNYFIVIFIQIYRSLEQIRIIKINEINNLKRKFIESKLNNLDDLEKWVDSYKIIGKIIAHLSPLVPAIKNDTYLQGVLSKLSNLSDSVTNYNDNITIVKNEKKIKNIIEKLNDSFTKDFN